MKKQVSWTEKNLKILSWVLSIAIPLAVAALFEVEIEGVDLSFLPPIYAGINGATVVVLVLAVFQIRKGNRESHEWLMKFAISLSVLFLLMYIANHATSGETRYGDLNHDGVMTTSEIMEAGVLRMVYLTLLISHIALSIIVIPLVLNTYLLARFNKFDKHRKLAKITFPVWLFVAVSGVIVYFMIAPFYH